MQQDTRLKYLKAGYHCLIRQAYLKYIRAVSFIFPLPMYPGPLEEGIIWEIPI